MSSSDLLLSNIEDGPSRENYRRIRLLLQAINDRLAKLEAGGTGGGASTFIGLSDTPENYDGAGNLVPPQIPTTSANKAGNIARVNINGDKLEFIDPIGLNRRDTSTTVPNTPNTCLLYTSPSPRDS